LILFHAYLILLRCTSSVPAFRRRRCHYRAPHNQETKKIFVLLQTARRKKQTLADTIIPRAK
jgi:hypothetical protein